MSTVTDDLVLVQLRDGHYLPIPAGIATGTSGVTFLGLDANGNAVVHVQGTGPVVSDCGPEVVNRRAFPAPFVDDEDYRLSMRCTGCGDVADDLRECAECLVRVCGCLLVLDCGGGVCADCADDHGRHCRTCASE